MVPVTFLDERQSGEKPYLAQTKRIRQAWPKLSKFYRDHIVQTVEPGPTYPAFDAIAARILHSERGL